jgi:FkbM family methyltransferase
MTAGRRQAVVIAVIKGCRRLVANTPVQRWPITSKVYRWVFRSAFRGPEVRAELRGVQLQLPSKDVTIVPGIIGGYYEKLELDVFECLASESRTIVDVGGNLGLYAVLAASRMGPEGRVLACEPVPENLGYLRRNVELNELEDQVCVEGVAIGESRGILQIHLAAQNVGTHSASARNAAGTGASVEVPVTTIDALCAEHELEPVDVLKIDVEGYDGFALRGGREVIARDHPALFLEYVPHSLSNCGFEPSEFLDVVFERDADVYIIDDVKGTIRRASRQTLEGSSVHDNANLVVLRRGSHRSLMRAWLSQTGTDTQ